MAQHDMNIANQGFPATRADLNNALQALVSNSSGTSAPSTTFANQWWYDTTNNKMYIRNEANNAWIEVFTLDQTNNEWQLTTGVVQAKDSDGLALRTDDGTTRLFIKDSNGHVSLGHASPATQLDVDGGANSDHATFSGTAGRGLKISTSSGGAADEVVDFDAQASGSTQAFTFSLGAAEVVRINNTGLGINKTAPDSELHVRGSRPHIDIEDSSAGQRAKVGAAFDNMYMGPTATAGDIFFKTGITSNGAPQDSGNTIMLVNGANQRVGIGTTGPTYKLTVSSGGMASAAEFSRNTDGTLRSLLRFRSSSQGADVGFININNSSTSYATSSDYRLKENITDVTDGITRVKQLAPKRFNFISEPDITVDGFIAHEASTVVPEAVTGEKDATRDEEYEIHEEKGEIYTPATEDAEEIIHSTDVECPEELEEGQRWRLTTKAVMGTRTVPDYQGLDQSKLVPLLTAALQEAIAKIEALETRVAALEG